MAKEKKMNKKKVAIIAAAVAAAVAVAGVASYLAFFKNDDKNTPDSESESSQEEIEGDLPSSKGDATSSSDANSKYSDAEVYTNEKGNPAAKTESGVEVELTPDNVARLFEEYEKVKGTNSEREKELLDQIQLILEVPRDDL